MNCFERTTTTAATTITTNIYVADKNFLCVPCYVDHQYVCVRVRVCGKRKNLRVGEQHFLVGSPGTAPTRLRSWTRAG